MRSWPGWVVAGALWLYFMTPVVAYLPRVPWLLLGVQVGAGLVGVVAILLRRRLPFVAVLGGAATLLACPAALGAVLFCQASIARHGRRVWSLVTAALVVAAKLVGQLVGPARLDGWRTADSYEMGLTVTGVVVATLVGWLVVSQTAGAESATAAALARRDAETARLEQARMAERERIAREMHDVLAHRLSLVALHAGVLAYRRDLDEDTARETAALIQSNARRSLDDLRAVLGDLRSPGSARPAPPQPTLAELPVLFAEASDAGQRIDPQVSLAPETVPPTLSRQLYRVVQEAVTNARKHAPGAPVTVRLDRRRDAHGRAGVRVVVTNPLPDLALATLHDPAPGRGGSEVRGFGLVGIAERAASTGGTARHGVVDDRFELEVFMPGEVAG